MKKNISINISGIIFHIEEDGYETLRKYLDSINKYFSSFEDSSEIMADIESRIAEIFLSRLNEGKQVITAEDVTSLIATMGSVNDFKAVEEHESAQPGNTSSSNSTADQQAQDTTSSSSSSQSKSYQYTPKQLRRDQQRKILGGVCAGIANYSNIDAVWLRLLFTVLTIATYGIALVVYLIMWIVIPGSYTLEEPQVEKKMFRDPERKVLGGVAGGLASYFGVDIVIIRVLFVAFIFAAGAGVLVYAVLWVILPEAKSLTDRMQMQGEAVTLSNIDSTIKKNRSADAPEDESTMTKILLFPFRLIGMILSGLAKILAPLLDVIRVALGVIVILMGVAMALTVVVAGGITVGIFSSTAFNVPWGMESEHLGIPIEAMARAFPVWVAVAGFVASIVPAIFVTMLGSSIIAKRLTFSAATGWTYFILFFISVIILSIGIPKMIYTFKEEGTYRVETVYPAPAKRAVLRINEVGLDDYHKISLVLEGYEGKDFKLVQEFQAQGSTRQRAIENAKMVNYLVDVKDSVFTFDSNITFKDDAVFRAQRLHMTLYIPYNALFTMNEDASRFISQYVDGRYLEGETWRMTANGLECVSCPLGQESQTYETTHSVELNGLFDVTIKRGHNYNVEFDGPDNLKNLYTIERRDHTLVISFNKEDDFVWKDFTRLGKSHFTITLTELQRIEAQGAGQVEWEGFQFNDLTVDLRGVIKAKGEQKDTENVTIQIQGASQLELEGNATWMEADLEGTSHLKAYKFEVQRARVEAEGVSVAEVNVKENLEIDESMTSKVKYRGEPTLGKQPAEHETE